MTEPVLPFSAAMVRFLEMPVALQLATAGAGLRPKSTRGFGCWVEEDRRTLRLSVLEAQNARFLGALEVGSRVAVNATNILDLRAVQAKGSLLEQRAATDAEREATRRYREGFCEALLQIGVPRDGMGALWHSGPVAVLRVAVDTLFDQTPGPDAGNRLEETWARL